MTDQHTPGPWTFAEHPEGRAGVRLPRGPMIARCEAMFGRPHVSGSEWEANALLIAAAPDLLAAARAMVDATERDQHFIGVEHDALVAAIAKAEGR